MKLAAIISLLSTAAHAQGTPPSIVGPQVPGDCLSIYAPNVLQDGGIPCPGIGFPFVLPNGTTATTQSPFSDNTTDVATDAFVQGAISLNSTHFAAGGTSTGTAAAQVISTTSPPVFSLTGTPTVTFIAGFTSTGATTLNVVSTGVKNILKKTAAGLVALQAGDLVAGQQYLVTYDGTQYELQTLAPITQTFSDNTTLPATDAFVQGAISLNSTHFAAGGTSGGSANAQTIATTSPPVFSLTGNPTVTFTAGFSNSGAITLNTVGTGVKNVLKKTQAGLVPLITGDVVANQQYLVTYDGTQYELQTPSQATNGQLANMAARSLKCNATSGAAIPTDCTSAQLPAFVKSSQAGFITAYFDSVQSLWVAQKPDGTFLSTAGTTTCGLQEAATYAGTSNYSVIYYGQSTTNGCAVGANTTITFPAAYGVSYYIYNASFTFNNTSQWGFIFDSQRYGTFWYDGEVTYTGTKGAWLWEPSHGPGGLSCASNNTACWSLDYRYHLGTVFIAGGGALACFAVDPSLGGSTGLTATNFVDNIISWDACEGQQNVLNGFFSFNGNNAFVNFAENTFNFGNIEGIAGGAAISIGQNATNPAASTNIWNGNVQVTGVTSGTFGIDSWGQLDVFNLQSLNCNQNAAGQVNVRWDSSAALNTIYTPQAVPCSGAALPVITDSSTAKTNNIYILPNFTTPLPRAVAGLPTCAAATKGWTYIVTDNNTAAAWNAAVTGSGAIQSFVKCDATSWKQF